MNLKKIISLKLWKNCHTLLTKISDNLDSIFLFVGLTMLAVGLWGLSETIYLPLAIIGCEFMILGVGTEKKEGEAQRE